MISSADAASEQSIQPTSAATLLSTVHGRDRRHLRSLQAAMKYGVKEKEWPDPRTGMPRWKYEIFMFSAARTRSLLNLTSALPSTTLFAEVRITAAIQPLRSVICGLSQPWDKTNYENAMMHARATVEPTPVQVYVCRCRLHH